MALSMRLDEEQDRWTLVMSGDLDYSECASFRMTIDRILKHGPPTTVIDLSAIDHLDSSGLGLLLSLSKEYGANGGRLVLVTNDSVDSILDLTRLSTIFSCASSVAEAGMLLGEAGN
jgi:anti-sigma B factor antagonist